MTFRTFALALALIAPLPALAQANSAPSTPPPSNNDLPDAPGATPQVAPPLAPTGPTVLFDTTMGRLTCKLYDKEAPIAVANFIGLATGTRDWTDPRTDKKVHGKSLYNGTVFHRVIPSFMIQGGDPIGTGMGDPGYYFEDEFNPALTFDVPGRLAMANSGPGTNGSQFFITEVPVPQLTGKHTIFGQCDAHTILLVATIARVDRDSSDKPTTPVVINKVIIVREGQPIPPDPYAPPAAIPAAPAPAK
jgi:peptidyl-prolyl cis-trans isomerase A (cyclophilin A)